MKLRIHAATVSVLIAAGTAAVQPANAEAAHPVMVLQHNPAVGDKLWRTTQSCVGHAQAGRFEKAMPFRNLAIRYAERELRFPTRTWMSQSFPL